MAVSSAAGDPSTSSGSAWPAEAARVHRERRRQGVERRPRRRRRTPASRGPQESRRTLRLGRHPELVGRRGSAHAISSVSVRLAGRPRRAPRLPRVRGPATPAPEPTVRRAARSGPRPSAARPSCSLSSRSPSRSASAAAALRRRAPVADGRCRSPVPPGAAAPRRTCQPPDADSRSTQRGAQPAEVRSAPSRAAHRVDEQRMRRAQPVGVDDAHRPGAPPRLVERVGPRQRPPRQPGATGRRRPGTPTAGAMPAGQPSRRTRRTCARSRLAVHVSAASSSIRGSTLSSCSAVIESGAPSSGSTVTISRTAPLTASWYTSVGGQRGRAGARRRRPTARRRPTDSRAARSTAAVLPVVGDVDADRATQRTEPTRSRHRPGHPGGRPGRARSARRAGHRRLARHRRAR